MTLPEAKSIARHLGLTLRLLRSGNYRVNFRDGDETTAYYTDDLEDAVSTAVEMARKQEVANAGAEAELVAQPMILAATNKYLAKSNKSRLPSKATKRRNDNASVTPKAGFPVFGSRILRSAVCVAFAVMCAAAAWQAALMSQPANKGATKWQELSGVLARLKPFSVLPHSRMPRVGGGPIMKQRPATLRRRSTSSPH
jgi:hypothetical protein